jgi:hypothetical protein
MSMSGDDRRERVGRRRRLLAFRKRQVPIRALIPNMFTLLGLVAGLTAIRLAIESRHAEALVLIVVAAIIDGIDGRLARLLKAQSRFGPGHHYFHLGSDRPTPLRLDRRDGVHGRLWLAPGAVQCGARCREAALAE